MSATGEPWFYRQDKDSLLLTLHIQPGAKTTGFVGRYGGAMKLRLAAQPVDGKANEALCRFVAEFCGLPRSAVHIVSGQTSRQKRVRISHADAEIQAKFAALER